LRSAGAPRPECASEFPPVLVDAAGLSVRACIEIGIDVAIGIAPGGRGLALLIADKAAIAAAAAEIAALDAERKVPCRGGRGRKRENDRGGGEGNKRFWHGFAPFGCRQSAPALARSSASLGRRRQFTFVRGAID
jgi:hypothetical protein